MRVDTVSLAQRLIRLRTDGAGEAAACDVLEPRLVETGFRTVRSRLSDGRESLEAVLAGEGPALVLTGHLDTVPVAEEPWEHAPFGGELVDGDLHGRGSVDMKAGVAAMVVAAERLALEGRDGRPLRLLFTAGEEQGCLGARVHVDSVSSDVAGAVIVGEPTSCEPVLAHKGVVWLQLRAEGRAAHASAPHLGDNAVLKLAGALLALEQLRFAADDTHLGSPTWSVGTFHGGVQTNVVPAEAAATVDVRLVPGLEPDAVVSRVAEVVGDQISVEPLLLLPAVETPVHDPFVQLVGDAVRSHGGVGAAAPVSYFTDASVLSEALEQPPIVICGPGDPALAHQRDERCPLEQIERIAAIYLDVARRWRSGE
jgi:succinyl-diaminopimelate desuccinylase